MENGIAVRELPPNELELVRNTIAKGATDDELKLFLYDCARRGVHPLDKLLHFTVRTDSEGNRRYTPITSIDFMRMQAADAGCAGIDDVLFTGTPKQEDFTASVTVYRVVNGIRCPFTGTARWPEYYPGDGGKGAMWRKMPHTMLGKCAEALSLRKAFPRQLGGLYSREEMDQAGMVDAETKTLKPPQKKEAPHPVVYDDPQHEETVIEPAHSVEEPSAEVISEKQRKRLYAIWKQAGWGDDEFMAALKEVFHCDSTTMIPKKDYEQVCEMAERGKPATRS